MVEAEEMETPFRADVLLISCCSSIVLERTTKKKPITLFKQRKRKDLDYIHSNTIFIPLKYFF